MNALVLQTQHVHFYKRSGTQRIFWGGPEEQGLGGKTERAVINLGVAAKRLTAAAPLCPKNKEKAPPTLRFTSSIRRYFTQLLRAV